MAELSGLEIEQIIKVCSQYGVSRFELGDLAITFNRWPTFDAKQEVQSSSEGDKPEEVAKETTLDDLFIEDPSAYEDALLRATDK